MKKSVSFILVMLTMAMLLATSGCPSKSSTTTVSPAQDVTNYGISLEKEKKYDEAIAEFDKAIALDPNYVPAYNERGSCYFLKGQDDLVIADLTTAIKLDPGDVFAYSLRGTAYYIKLQYDLAIADLSSAIKLSPGQAIYYRIRGDAYRDNGQPGQAIADYNQVIELSKDADQIQYAAGELVKLYPAAIPGDPPFSSNFNSTPTLAKIGPFTTQAGDCFVSYTMTDAEFSAYLADYSSAPIRKKILDAVQANFKDRVDVVIVILDVDEYPPSFPCGVNYPVQNSSVHNPNTPRFARLGNLWLERRRGLTEGPSLHELLHGFQNKMTKDETANFIIPTTDASHWGFSSAGGQLGGWDKSTLVSLGNGIYQAKRPPFPPGFVQKNTFGLNANWGNTLPYSNLELWTMGLIPDSELDSVDVAEDASFIDANAGQFKAKDFVRYSPSAIIARIQPDSRPSTNTPRAFRGLVILASTRTVIDAATVTQLNSDIEQFSMRATPKSGSYNFWTATGMRASIQLAMASELAR